MNATHTPGPWHVGGNGTVVYASDGWAITVTTMVHVRDNTIELAKANAMLIAAAPDMLAVLAGCADALSESGKDFAIHNPLAVRPNLYELHAIAARAAILKATQ